MLYTSSTTACLIGQWSPIKTTRASFLHPSSSSPPRLSYLYHFSPCFKTDCLLPSQRHLVLIDWQVTEEEEHSVTGGIGSADRPQEKHDVHDAVLQSMWDNFWLEGSVAKDFQFCMNRCATQIERHATCKQMHTRLHFRRADVYVGSMTKFSSPRIHGHAPL